MTVHVLDQTPAGGTILAQLSQSMDSFLVKWPAKTKATGYFEFTTAIRDDWGKAFDGVLLHMIKIIDSQGPVCFSDLVGLGRPRHWARFVVAEAERHRHRGVTAEMFLVCFKNLVHAVEEIVDECDAPVEEKYRTIGSLRIFFDAMECCIVGDWTESFKDEGFSKLQETNRSLTLQKNKYENIFDATSDLVLVTDKDGVIVEANAAARQYFYDSAMEGSVFWEPLGMEGNNISEVLRYYPMDQTHELSLSDESQFFILKITHLTKLAKTTGGYMMILSNVSCQVDKRERLESLVQQHTQALANSEKQFRALFQAAGEGILVVNEGMQVVKANERACRAFGYPAHALEILPLRMLTDTDGFATLSQAIVGLQMDQIWSGELNGLRRDLSTFPMEVTLSCVSLVNQPFFHIIVKDITNQKALKKKLLVEKGRLEEMNVTLINVMKAIDKEKNALERNLAHKINTLLLPSMDKLQREPVKEIRDGHIQEICGHLLGLANNTADEFDLRFLRLSRTENQICRQIQAGLSSKDIAHQMNIAYATIQTHRKNIRRKLGLRGRDINMFTFLNKRNSFPGNRAESRQS